MDNEKIKQLTQIFSALADETRLHIVLELMKNKSNVSDLHETLNKKNKITLSAISHQLKLLSNLKLLEYEKIGREKIFFPAKNFCWCLLNTSINHYQSKCSCGCNISMKNSTKDKLTIHIK